MRKVTQLLRLLRRKLMVLIHSFRFTMIGTFFLIMLVSGILIGGLVSAVVLTIPESISGANPLILILVSLPGSILLGTFLSIIVSKLVLRPLDDMIAATEEVAKGNFNIVMPIDTIGLTRCNSDYLIYSFCCLMIAWAAERRAIGTRNGLHET